MEKIHELFEEVKNMTKNQELDKIISPEVIGEFYKMSVDLANENINRTGHSDISILTGLISTVVLGAFCRYLDFEQDAVSLIINSFAASNPKSIDFLAGVLLYVSEHGLDGEILLDFKDLAMPEEEIEAETVESPQMPEKEIEAETIEHPQMPEKEIEGENNG